MQKQMNKPNARAKQRDDLATIVADMYGVSARYVRMVRNGERENEQILGTLIEMREGKNLLIQSVKELIPIGKVE